MALDPQPPDSDAPGRTRPAAPRARNTRPWVSLARARHLADRRAERRGVRVRDHAARRVARGAEDVRRAARDDARLRVVRDVLCAPAADLARTVSLLPP